MKKLIPALCMLLISAILMGTSTYAWFSMNNTVSATNMQVTAVGDTGILINEVATASDANWDDAARTSQSESIKLHATSTANTGTWYVAYSKVQDDAAAATAGNESQNLTTEGYQVLGTDITTGNSTIAAAASGSNAETNVTFVDADGDNTYDNGEGYYVRYTYYLKSSAGEISTSLAAGGRTLNIKEVSATSTTATSANLDKSLRVAVVVNNKAYIYAPKGGTSSYYVNASSTATTVLDHTVSQPTSLATIPASTANGTPVYIYLYFEGEDADLKTSNITTTLDNLNVTVLFELKTNTTAVTDNGVAIS